MADKYDWVKIGKRKLKLSNLDKVLYPQNGFLKAEVVEYYHRIAPTMLYHIKGRPLTLIRYPDGIDEERFYQKNVPKGAPAWIETIRLGSEEKKDYILPTEQATLIWLANLASLELHQMHSRKPHYNKPDYMVFDLDPPPDSKFDKVVDIAFLLKEHIEQYGYRVFVKTTGGKGLHLVIPLVPEVTMREVFESSKMIAQEFVDRHNNRTTLQIKKKARKGRILVDIYRNRPRQTIIAPYSLRGKTGAPVSMPLRWNELKEIHDSKHYHLKNAVEKVMSDGDAWEGIGSYAAILHTHRNENDGDDQPESINLSAKLDEYTRKRDRLKTTEPFGEKTTRDGNRFVIHRHHATRLHYDLRLEKDGVLLSFAVPKGMPPQPGIKRLTIQTEDHPLEYLTFEGTIPKGEYGAGKVWVFAIGKYETTKEKEGGMYFRLDSPALSGEYRMHNTGGKEWLLEKVDEPQVDWLHEAVEPMHGTSVDSTPGDQYLYEVKWDGIRALITWNEGEIRIRSRNKNDITQQFPELVNDAPDAFRATCGVFDGEIVCLDSEGRPRFQKVINRLKTTGESGIRRLSKRNPVHCYLFDCLYLDGRALINDPLERRLEWLADSIKTGTRYRISETMDDGYALFRAIKEHGMEGIMAKRRGSKYRIAKRSDLWKKVKVQHTVDCLVIGYTRGEGDRHRYFGALHLAEQKNGDLIYRGKVGTGFDENTLRDVWQELKKLEVIKQPPVASVPDDPYTVWVKPEMVVEVDYARLSANGMFKEAVFVRLRPEKAL